MIARVATGVFCAYLLDVTVREQVVSARAQKIARRLGKPILHVGSGYRMSSATGEKLRGHVNCDLAAPRTATCGVGRVCHCDVQDLSQFADKQFGVALACNVMPYVQDKARARRELARVADVVVESSNIIPWPQIGAGPRFPV